MPSQKEGVENLAENLFRQESGRLVSVLTRMVGTGRLQLAEDVVQEALLRALKTWPYYGVPENPAAWLTQTAKNLAFDVLRREKTFQTKEPGIAQFLGQTAPQPSTPDIRFETEVEDDTLRLMFACCHPEISLEDQAALALKTLCGFSASEIASAFLSTEAAVTKRLTRARQRIRDLRLPFEIPAGKELLPRLDGVLQTLYLLHNEGYKASGGGSLIRRDLCMEAIRLITLLARHPVGNLPATHALLALMLFNTARFPARQDADEKIVRLQDQDRTLWDQRMMALGLRHMEKSAVGSTLTLYHLQAAISAHHCTAPDYDSTNWTAILSLYDTLVRHDPSPVAALNRAVAVSHVHGPSEGIKAVQAIPNCNSLARYYLLHAVLAEFETRQDRYAEAARHLKQAITYAGTTAERDFLASQLAKCEQQATPRH